MSDREPVGQVVNSMIAVLDELVAMALDPPTVADVEAERIGLIVVISRASQILALIDGRSAW